MSQVKDSDMDISVPFTFEDPGESALPNAVMKGQTIFDPYTNISTFIGMWGFSSADLGSKNCSPCEYAGKFREPTNVEGTFTMKMENQEDERVKDTFKMALKPTETRWLHNIVAAGENRFGPFIMKGVLNLEEGENTGTFELSKYYVASKETSNSVKRDKKRKNRS